MRSTRIAAIALAATLAAGVADAATNVVLPRPGQVGISLQLGYGMLADGAGAGEAFSDGASYAIRLRYRMRYDRGFGLSFESDRFEARVKYPYDPSNPDSTIKDERLGVILSGLEFYQMFGTRTPTVKMISIGAGLAQHRVKKNDGETELTGTYSGDGPFLSAGFGVERFFYRSWAVDFSARYYALFRESKTTHDGQIAIGVIGYAGY
jgi:hypothetical protein